MTKLKKAEIAIGVCSADPGAEGLTFEISTSAPHDRKSYATTTLKITSRSNMELVTAGSLPLGYEQACAWITVTGNYEAEAMAKGLEFAAKQLREMLK